MTRPVPLSRRQLLLAGTLGLGGFSLPQLFEIQASLGGQLQGRAKNAIFVFLNGGPSQLDTFDMKPSAPEGIRGPYKPIATAVAGTQICEKLPRLARLTNKFSILRSAKHHLTAHNSSAAYALSGHSPGTDADISPGAMDHPTYGSVVSRLCPTDSAMPSFVLTPRLLFDMGFPTPSAGGGWLGRDYDPFPVARNRMMARAPEWDGRLPVPAALTLPDDVSRSRLADRSQLLAGLNRDFPAADKYRRIRTLDHHRSQALELLLSAGSREAFDVSAEPAEYHERYGRFEMGQAMLLARRLIESGVRFVTANAVSNPKNTRLSPFQIWDTHFDHFRLYNDNLLPEFDQAFSALITDLDERGLLDETLVFAMGEMGRTPKINDAQDGGRDHWGRAYCVLWAGAGVHAGGVFGATDRQAGDVVDMPASPDDIAATIYEAFGIPHETVLPDFTGRPRHITDGRPIAALLS
jgi:uncharacterized protein (DUF1501 family)